MAPCHKIATASQSSLPRPAQAAPCCLCPVTSSQVTQETKRPLLRKQEEETGLQGDVMSWKLGGDSGMEDEESGILVIR